MPAYRVQISAEAVGLSLKKGHDSMVVFAGTAADAKAMAQGHYEGDANAAWSGATATEIAVSSAFSSDFSLNIDILDSSPVVSVSASGVLGCSSVSAVAAGGASYAENDILTLVGGTKTRAATYKVTSVSGGAVTGVALIDPGEYTVAPSNPVATTNDGSGDDNCTLTCVFTSDLYANFWAECVGLLNAESAIAGAALDMSTPLLTIAAISDGLGDKQVSAEFRYKQVAIPGLMGAIVDEGIAAAVLSAAPVASPVLPNVLESYKNTY